MKTAILTTAIFFATVFGISQSTYAATANKEVSTVLTEVGNISEIEVHGNVELYVSDATADKVKVYNSYYSESALVQDQNGVLRISSYLPQKLVVWVSVSDLRKLSVYDNAEVKSFGKLSAIDLDVKLFNTASAQLDMNTFATSITLNDHAKADLTGTVTEASLKYARSSSLNTTNLAVSHLAKTETFPTIKCRDTAELASL
jgi:Putative auto-transporter adhesin, head GIN domain